MADTSIRQEFVEGVHEIFTTLFNNGSEDTDGVFLYLLSDKTTTSVYGESKYKVYKKPVLLVCKAVLTPSHGEQDVETVKNSAEFTVTYKSLTDNGLDVTAQSLDQMCRGIMKFHDVFYTIDQINPKAYVEDVFLMYGFQCTEDTQFDESSLVVEEDPEDEVADKSVDETGELVDTSNKSVDETGENS